MHSETCWTRPQIALAAAMIFLTACAEVDSEGPHGACPPVVEYTSAEQAIVAKEIAALPEGALIVDWMADYAVLRDQARRCHSKAT